MSERSTGEFIGPQSPTDRMLDLLIVIRGGDYSEVAELKEYMDLYDAMGFSHRKRPDGKERSDELLETLDTSEAEFDYIVARYDIATSAFKPTVRANHIEL